MKIETYTISEKHNAFVWLPPKCATNFISWVLAYFEFSSIAMDTETNQIHRIMPNQSTHFGHSTILPPNHEELSFICAIRHPYHRILSMYQSQVKDPSVGDFEKLFKMHGLIIKSIHGNYDFSRYDETESPRMIIVAEKS